MHLASLDREFKAVDEKGYKGNARCMAFVNEYMKIRIDEHAFPVRLFMTLILMSDSPFTIFIYMKLLMRQLMLRRSRINTIMICMISYHHPDS